jgi:hypothetical protein
MKKTLFIILVLLLTGILWAENVQDGWWTQTASTAGDADMIVAMKITEQTPHIISLASNNGWVGYAWYDEGEGCYSGFFELVRPASAPERDDWTGEVFHMTLTYDGLTLTMKAESPERDFRATYWHK